MSDRDLGRFDHLLLLAVMRLGDERLRHDDPA